MSSRRSARISAAASLSDEISKSTAGAPAQKVARAVNGGGSTKVAATKKRKADAQDSSDVLSSSRDLNNRKRKAESEDPPELSLPSNDVAPKKRKAASKAAPKPSSEEVPEPALSSNDAVLKKRKPTPKSATPSTPQKKSKAAPILPPITPTPSAINLMSDPYNPAGSSPPTGINRLAIPNSTNAPLVTPETHRLITHPPMDTLSPSKPSSTPKTSTSNILDQAIAHLIAIEPKLKPIIEKYPCRIFSPEGLAEEIDPFQALVSGIISQQVSGAAASSIKAKFISLFSLPPGEFPPPSVVIQQDIPTLRTAGLSQRKAEYIHGLATSFHSGELTTSFLFSAPYEEVFEALIKVRGLGKWSVEMFACFALKRMDVFSVGDLGVQRGMAALVGRDVEKLKKNAGKGKNAKWKYMAEKEMEEIAERFSPYRTLFMWYMWRVEDVDVSSLE